jgi:hypothetical protein
MKKNLFFETGSLCYLFSGALNSSWAQVILLSQPLKQLGL